MKKRVPYPGEVITTDVRIFYTLKDGTVWENTSQAKYGTPTEQAQRRMRQEDRIVKAEVVAIDIIARSVTSVPIP